ncbi:EamA family transporter [Demequina soli]|uniref:EamA family transporter n=1 Tax=Demequina soli TaxID=1638987 RepID=UPI0007838AF1|nr:DMT family transporter [Demequina soli]
MTSLTHDTARASRLGGIGFALLSATAFGLSGSLARGLLDAGWTAGAATLARVLIAAIVLAGPAIVTMRGRWALMRRAAGTIVAYGVFAVAGAQLFYFLAVGTLDVGVALLVEYMAPVIVIGYLWIVQGSRPGVLTLAGAGLALAGLALLLDLFGGSVSIDLVGVGWALLAMVGAAVYFVISADTSTGLPPVALAWGGLVLATAMLALAGVAGILPMTFTANEVHLLPFTVPAWLVVLALGAISGAVSYVAGIAATRRLGARLGSFVALFEVIAAAGFAWLFIGQVPAPIQFGGAALILAGVVLIRLGEPAEPAVAHEVEPGMPLAVDEPVDGPREPLPAAA